MTIPKEIGAAAISGGGTLLNSLLNYGSQRETNDRQVDLMREQNAFQERLLDKQMQYNSESAKVQRLGAAGLNPALAFSDASQIGSASAASAPSLQAPMNEFSDVGINAAQAFATVAAGSKDNAEAKGIEIDNMTRDQLNLKRLDEIESIIANSNADKVVKEAALEMTNLEKRLFSETFDARKQSFELANKETAMRTHMIDEQAKNFAADAAYKDSMTALNDVEIMFKPAHLRAAIQATMSQIQVDKSIVSLNGELSKKAVKEALLAKCQARGVYLNNKQLEAIAPYVEKQAEYAAKQAAQNYSNPFHYIFGAGSGMGAAFIKTAAK